LNQQAFLQQVKASQGIIYKLVSLYAADAEEKKDMYQEVLLQAWKAWPNFRGDAKFSTWLYRICLNTIFTLKRKPNRIAYGDLPTELPATSFSTSEQIDKVKALQWAIRQLSETDRALISLHLDGYDNTEVAQIIGISNNHVAVKLHRIKQQLSNLLNQQP
jgi:RNA polymerase sigma factor (sigma-70 family)